MTNVKFDAILPVRITGQRLFGKPMQLIDIRNNVSVLEYLVKYIERSDYIQDICLAIADSPPNHIFIEVAEKNGWKYVLGDEDDMLGRIIKSARQLGTDVVFKGSTESPFLYNNKIDHLYEQHVSVGYDLSIISHLPEGAGFSINGTGALEKSHKQGSLKHRGELVHLYINENPDKFKIHTHKPSKIYRRPKIRITIDYPEDLVFCRIIYQALNGDERLIEISEIIKFWDKNPELRKPMEEIGIDWGHGRIWK